MRFLQKIFFIGLVLCVVSLGYFLYKDFFKGWINNYYARKNEKKIIDDGKIHIVLDAGHGGIDVGAIGKLKDKKNLYEKDVSRKVVDIMITMIDTSRYKVVETRLGDAYTHRHNRMLLARSFKPNLLVSLHCNSFTNKNWTGTEIHICYRKYE